MINRFLCGLFNSTDVSFGVIPRPGAWYPEPYTGARLAVQRALLVGSSRRDRFHSAVALTLLLRHSVFRADEVAIDARVTYGDDDLAQELVGNSDIITAPAGISVSYTAATDAPHEQLWLLRRSGANTVSVNWDGFQEVIAGVVFSPTAQVSIVLRSGITVHVVGDLGIGAAITIARSTPYPADIGAMVAALRALPERDLLSVVPARYHAISRNSFAFNNANYVVSAAVGVSNGG